MLAALLHSEDPYPHSLCRLAFLGLKRFNKRVPVEPGIFSLWCFKDRIGANRGGLAIHWLTGKSRVLYLYGHAIFGFDEVIGCNFHTTVTAKRLPIPAT